ncbi:MAG: phosphoglucomutase/phosphomannomutase family protein [Candidatus Neomarinimicrobiota bacterium]
MSGIDRQNNPDNRIKFGTDGWRAVIADEFTSFNVRAVAQALCDYLISAGSAQNGVAIGFDTRFLSAEFAEAVAEVIASNRIPAFLSKRFCPTPVLSFTVKNRNLAAGIMVTASHNPPQYNGLKFKGSYGGPATIEMTTAVEGFLFREKPRRDERAIDGFLHKVDFFPEYAKHLSGIVNIGAISTLLAPIIYNAMHGAGSGYLPSFLRNLGRFVSQINARPDPMFGGKLPEPILSNLSDLRKAVLRKKAAVGLATDGDADRFGILDENGKFVELHDLMPLLFEYLLETRNWPGNVVRTTSMADTIDKVAAEHGRQVVEVPVGFKNVSDVMRDRDILIGGEESGGFGYKNHIPERDGILSCLLTLEMLSGRKIPISEMVADLRKRFGAFHYGRIDRHHPTAELIKNMEKLCENSPVRIGQFAVDRISLIDGIKFYFTDGSWMLMRVSQTEPLGRVYVASDAGEKVRALLTEGVRLLTQ